MTKRFITIAAAGGILLAMGAFTQASSTNDAQEQAQVGLGKKVYSGNPGGALCSACHGPAAKGIPGAGPDLTDKAWIHGDGSEEFLRGVITSGVPAPKQSAMPMPPNGGGKLNRQQVDALIAYLGSLSTK